LILISPIPRLRFHVDRLDEEHVIAYLRLLDADAQGADWREVARIKSGNFAQRVGIVPDPKNPRGPDCGPRHWIYHQQLVPQGGLISGLTRAYRVTWSRCAELVKPERRGAF
jgi:hypothetical protein